MIINAIGVIADLFGFAEGIEEHTQNSAPSLFKCVY